MVSDQFHSYILYFIQSYDTQLLHNLQITTNTFNGNVTTTSHSLQFNTPGGEIEPDMCVCVWMSAY